MLSVEMLKTHDSKPLVPFECLAKSEHDARVHSALSAVRSVCLACNSAALSATRCSPSAINARPACPLLQELDTRMGAPDGSEPNTVFHALKELLGGGKAQQPNSILCTGYSTGGSVAALAVMRLALRFAASDTCFIAFGSP